MISYESISIAGVSGTAYSKTAVGTLEYIQVTYTNGDAGGDVVVSDDQTGLVFMTLTDKNATVAGCPKGPVTDLVGVVIADEYVKLPVVSRFKVAVAQEAANSVVNVELWWRTAA